jgi:hypothetical protein
MKVRYVTTVGWCGGREADFGKVIFCDKAIITDGSNPQLIRFGALDLYLDSVWLEQLEPAFPFVRPDPNLAILTSRYLQVPSAIINQFNGSKENIAGITAIAVDIYIGYIYSELLQTKGVEALHAIAVVTDSNRNKRDGIAVSIASRRAAHALIEYLQHLHNNQMINSSNMAPNEIISRGPEAIRAFQQALKYGKMKPFRSKLMVVGQARTGKTSLLRALNNLPFNDNEASTHVAEVVEVKVGEWSMTGAIYPAQDLFNPAVRCYW